MRTKADVSACLGFVSSRASPIDIYRARFLVIAAMGAQRFVPAVARRGGRGAGRRKYGRLVGQIAEADRAALSRMMAAADRLVSSIRRGDP